MKAVEIYFTNGKNSPLRLMLNDNEIMTLKEWVINESSTLTMYIESDKRDVTLFRSHIAYINYYRNS